MGRSDDGKRNILLGWPLRSSSLFPYKEKNTNWNDFYSVLILIFLRYCFFVFVHVCCTVDSNEYNIVHQFILFLIFLRSFFSTELNKVVLHSKSFGYDCKRYSFVTCLLDIVWHRTSVFDMFSYEKKKHPTFSINDTRQIYVLIIVCVFSILGAESWFYRKTAERCLRFFNRVRLS